jgi:probable rRNA maturation factor
VLISYPQAERQAEDGDIELELADLLVHGILHLMGHDHERAEDADKMFPLQDAIVAEIL